MINTSERISEITNLKRISRKEASCSLSLLNNIMKDKQAYLYQLKQAKMFKKVGKLQQNFKVYLNNHKEKPFKSLIGSTIFNSLTKITLRQKRLAFKQIQKRYGQRINFNQNKFKESENCRIKVKHFIFLLKNFTKQHQKKLTTLFFKQLKNSKQFRIQGRDFCTNAQQKILEYSPQIKSSNQKKSKSKQMILTSQQTDKNSQSYQNQLNKQNFQEQKNCLLNQISQLECKFREMALKYVRTREGLQQEAKKYNCNFNEDSQSLSIDKEFSHNQSDSQNFSLSLNLKSKLLDEFQINRLSQRNQELNEEIDHINSVVEDLFLTNIEQMKKNPQLAAILSQIKQMTKANILGDQIDFN